MRLVAAALTAIVMIGGTPQTPPYKNARLPIEDRVRDLLGRMTLEEKFWQLFMIPGSLDDPAHDYSKGIFGLQIDTGPQGTGPAAPRAHAERVNAIQRYFVERTRLGIPIIPFEEALHGLASEGATMFPQAIALAATFDPDLVARVASAAALETRTRGIRQALSPVVNIADDVRWGRVEETYGEDPWLSSAMTRAFVAAFERAGIVTTPKHFVANVGEGGRDSHPIFHNERLLAERYFPPFQAAIGSGARSIMTAYNSVDGLPATQNPRLLNEILKRDWGFRGFVISDASATGGATVLHMTEPDTPTAAKHALDAGLDVVFQSSYGQQRPYLEAFRKGMIDPAIVDAAVARILRVKFALGLFEQPYVDPEAAARANGSREHLALAREAAAASLVLLKNDRGTLPLGKTIRSLAVIGGDATEARLGGYSGPGVAKVSILDGLRAKFGAAVVGYTSGPGRSNPSLAVVPGEFQAEYFDNISLEGPPRVTRTDSRIDFRWTFNAPARGIPRDWYSVRWAGRVAAPASGARRLGVEGNDGYRLHVDGRLVIDNWTKRSYGTRTIDVAWPAGSSHDVRLEFFESTGNARIRLLWDAGVANDADQRIEEAVQLAREADASLIVAGVEEGEFRDRAFLSLPGRQEELIRRVAAAGKPVIVVIIGGSAVTMSGWIDRADAVIHGWYPGEQGGHAVADVLSGDVSPSGRLPITFPMSEGQLPLSYDHRPTGRGDDYVDLTGMPLFPFGHGLSYTTFAYSNLRIEPALIAPDGTTRVRCTVRDTGTRAAHEVVQLYIRDVVASRARPVLSLRGARRVRLAPGEATDVTLMVGPRELRMLDAQGRWIVEPGIFRVLVGASSEDIRLRGDLTVREP